MSNKKVKKPVASMNGIKSKYFKKVQENRLDLIQKLTNQERQKTTNRRTTTDNKTPYYQLDTKDLEVGNVPKKFKLSLEDYGPYSLEYSRDGNILLLYGKKGYVSMMNWKTKHLISETNILCPIASASFLNKSYYIAVAKQNMVTFYDKGTMIHNIDASDETCHLKYLPNHLLLVISTQRGKIMWLDISTGEIKSRTSTNIDNITALNVNTGTGVTILGDSKGVLSIWTPSQNKAVAYLKCHKSIINNIIPVPNGFEVVTTGSDRRIKIWDTRYLKETKNDIIVKNNISSLDVSQSNLLVAGLDTSCQIFDYKSNQTSSGYTCYRSKDTITGTKFCPNEDVLGISTASSFSSVLIPGSASESFTQESNPFASKSQQTETITHTLLSKIIPDMIVPEHNFILKTKKKQK